METAFAAAVAEALEGGLLRYSKRLELMKLGKELGIDRFQAALIIAQTQYRKGHLAFSAGQEAADDEAGRERIRRSELLLKIAALVLTAALADLLIVRVLFG